MIHTTLREYLEFNEGIYTPYFRDEGGDLVHVYDSEKTARDLLETTPAEVLDSPVFVDWPEMRPDMIASVSYGEGIMTGPNERVIYHGATINGLWEGPGDPMYYHLPIQMSAELRAEEAMPF